GGELFCLGLELLPADIEQQWKAEMAASAERARLAAARWEAEMAKPASVTTLDLGAAARAVGLAESLVVRTAYSGSGGRNAHECTLAEGDDAPTVLGLQIIDALRRAGVTQGKKDEAIRHLLR